MCGIAGVLSFSQTHCNQLKHVSAMTQAMRHRGPDDEGYITVQDGNVRNFLGKDTPENVRSCYPEFYDVVNCSGVLSQLAMGHRRLSILDLSPAGHQPMSDATGRYWIVFNGEIYNFKEIRSQLMARGHNFKSNSDTEVILASYVEWQEKCLTRFNGDFSFAIWDLKERYLFCARDRIGIKPFYYMKNNSHFIFGSDIKTIIASGLYSPEPDEEGLYLAMAFGISPRPITAFKNIRALEQSHWMRVFDDGSVHKERYWSIPVGTQDVGMKENDAVSLVDEQLQLAVERRLVADVPVGTFMSGGVDSTTISAIAAKRHPRMKAFTLGYQDETPEFDEVSQAAATASLHNMEHIIHRVDPNKCLSDLSEWVKAYEEPFYSLAANFVISKIVKENNVTVSLNGLGGDELFAGYRYYRRHRVPRFTALSFLKNYIEYIPHKKLALLLQIIGAETPDRLHTLLFCKTKDTFLRRLFHHSYHPKLLTPDLIHNLYAAGIDFSDTLEAMSFMDLTNYVGNHFVHRVDQQTMAHSVEGRFPYLDHELIEAVYRIPSKYKLHNGQNKFILRRVAEKYISPDCLKMKKKGFGLPLAHWMHGPLKHIVEQSLDRIRCRPQINPCAVNHLRESFYSGKVPATQVWHVVALELWFEEFIDPGMAVI